jgi:oleandomycin transport system ATP-binding protein
MTPAIYAEGLTKRFGDTTALAGIDLEVRPGTVLGLLGPNGSGKTTAVRVFATLIRADAGRALVGGYDVRHQAHQVRRLIGVTGQYAALDENLRGRENLYLIARLLGMPRAAAKARAMELIERFDLVPAAGRAVKTYSGGMRRRLDIAASLVGTPRILFLDEPTTGLDPNGRAYVWQVVRDLVNEGTTVLLTTQYLDEADQLSDSVTVLDHGAVIAAGTPDQLKDQTGRQVLELRPADRDRLEAAAGVLGALADGRPHVDAAAGRMHVAVTDPRVLTEVVRRLDRAGIVVAELSLRRPSLDEVFQALTGASRGDETPQAVHEERITA